MASLSGTFVADGVSAGVTGLSGNCDLSIKITGGDKGYILLQVSYNGETTYSNMEGGNLGQYSLDRTLIAGDAATYYRFKASGVSGTVTYYLGQS